MPLVDDVEEHIRGVRAVGKAPDFIDHEDGGVGIERQGRRQFASSEGGWLVNCVALDAAGFVKTGGDISSDELASTAWPLTRSRAVTTAW